MGHRTKRPCPGGVHKDRQDPQGRWPSFLRSYSVPQVSTVTDPFLVSMEKGWGAGDFILFLETYLKRVWAERR